MEVVQSRIKIGAMKTTGEILLEDRKAALNAVLESKEFSRAPALAKLLKYLCEKTFEGRVHEIKEFSIATEVYGRSENFGEKRDSVVRVEMSRLRKRLVNYYADEGIAAGTPDRDSRRNLCAGVRAANSSGRGRCPQICRRLRRSAWRKHGPAIAMAASILLLPPWRSSSSALRAQQRRPLAGPDFARSRPRRGRRRPTSGAHPRRLFHGTIGRPFRRRVGRRPLLRRRGTESLAIRRKRDGGSRPHHPLCAGPTVFPQLPVRELLLPHPASGGKVRFTPVLFRGDLSSDGIWRWSGKPAHLRRPDERPAPALLLRHRRRRGRRQHRRHSGVYQCVAGQRIPDAGFPADSLGSMAQCHRDHPEQHRPAAADPDLHPERELHRPCRQSVGTRPVL